MRAMKGKRKVGGKGLPMKPEFQKGMAKPPGGMKSKGKRKM